MTGIADLGSTFGDIRWRLRNLYGVPEEGTGQTVKYVPNAMQEVLYDALLGDGSRRVLILKARREGMSTAMTRLGLDYSLWKPGFRFSIVDQTQTDAEAKLRSMRESGFGYMDEALRGLFDLKPDSSSEIGFSLCGRQAGVAAGGLRLRGGDVGLLHVSEWGPIQYADARRSEEIKTGALPAARGGSVVVETTWKGRKGGELWGLVEAGVESEERFKRDGVRDPLAWRTLFFPWYWDPKYVRGGSLEELSGESLEYLEDMERLTGYKFSSEQKIWWHYQKQETGVFMGSEFPTVVDECWGAAVKGAIYQREVLVAEADGRVEELGVDGSLPVYTSWDLGSPHNTCVWYFQLVGGAVHWLRCDVGGDETTTQRVARMMGLGYNYGGHYLPHDAVQTERSGWRLKDELARAGLSPLFVVPRAPDAPLSGINRCLQRFGAFRFDGALCDRGLEGLSNYRWAENAKLETLQNKPVADWSSHIADAMRTYAEADMTGMLNARKGQELSEKSRGKWEMRARKKKRKPVLRGF